MKTNFMTQTVCTQEDGWLLWNNDAKFNWIEWKRCLDLVYILNKLKMNQSKKVLCRMFDDAFEIVFINSLYQKTTYLWLRNLNSVIINFTIILNKQLSINPKFEPCVQKLVFVENFRIQDPVAM